MTDNELPERMLNAMRDADERMRSMRPYLEQARENAARFQSLMPAVRQVLEYGAQVQEAAEIARSMRPLIQYVQQHAELTWRNLTLPPALAYADRVAQAMDAGMAQLAERVAWQAAPRTVTASAHLTATATVIAVAEVTKAADIGPVTGQQEAPAERDRSVNVVAFAVVLVWLWALTMPAAQLLLPQEAKDYLNGLWSTVGIALALHLAINEKRKH